MTGASPSFVNNKEEGACYAAAGIRPSSHLEKMTAEVRSHEGGTLKASSGILGETIGKQSKVQCSSVTPSLEKQTAWNRHKNMQVKTSSCQSTKKRNQRNVANGKASGALPAPR